MNDLMEDFDINPTTKEIEEKEWDLFKNSDSKLRNQKHLKMVHEWLIRNGYGGHLHLPNHFRGCEFCGPEESVKGNSQQHEMAYEQLRSRGKIRSLIVKRRIWWEPVLEASSYVVYFSPDRTVFDPGNFRWELTHGVIFKVVIGKAELILPDEWPEFHLEQGIYYIGITAKDEVGNESSPFMLEGLFKFISPQPPSNGGIEYL